jgi:RimJ/RimL family protein N-acetyltransferase
MDWHHEKDRNWIFCLCQLRAYVAGSNKNRRRPTMDGIDLQQAPTGADVPDWTPRPPLPPTPMQGRWCRLERLSADRHADSLFDAMQSEAGRRNWTYLLNEMPGNIGAYRTWVRERQDSCDPQFFAIVDGETGHAAGIASYLRIDQGNGTAEVGHINFTPLLQRRRAATEAMYLMMARVFELGYRRYEWKCDSLNAPSRAAAARLGFQFEGMFRQAAVYKSRNRDTAWFSVLDREWPALQSRFERWLRADNFAADGAQRRTLSECTD